jgi:hypothetical protein
MLKRDKTFGEQVWDFSKYAFILILVVFMTILLASSGPTAFFQFLKGGVGNEYAEVFGETITDNYRYAIQRNYCPPERHESLAARISCIDSAIQYIKELSVIADELGIDLSEKYLQSDAYNQLKEAIYSQKDERVDLMGKSNDELDYIIADEFESYWNSSPLDFKRDQYLLGSNPNSGFIFNFLRLVGMATSDDYKTEKIANKSQISFKIINI